MIAKYWSPEVGGVAVGASTLEQDLLQAAPLGGGQFGRGARVALLPPGVGALGDACPTCPPRSRRPPSDGLPPP
jgi:hypothetical protein